MIHDSYLEDFMRHSNLIEGEVSEMDKSLKTDLKEAVGALNKGDMECIKKFMSLKTITEKNLLEAHEKAFWHRLEGAGAYRLYNVRVGSFVPCDWKDVPGEMEQYFKEFKHYDSWQAHNLFEKIHPFGDGNGRMGRLIWLWKAYHKENFRMSLSFLHAYYYQTLSHVN